MQKIATVKAKISAKAGESSEGMPDPSLAKALNAEKKIEAELLKLTAGEVAMLRSFVGRGLPMYDSDFLDNSNETVFTWADARKVAVEIAQSELDAAKQTNNGGDGEDVLSVEDCVKAVKELEGLSDATLFGKASIALLTSIRDLVPVETAFTKLKRKNDTSADPERSLLGHLHKERTHSLHAEEKFRVRRTEDYSGHLPVE